MNNSSTIPYLGSKISLISKAKIRYEGILYTIDPNESTVALAKVRSFGTEDRPAENQVLPRDEIYEYIIFRASDIEDLQVSEPPRPTPLHETMRHVDPAIVQQAPQYRSQQFGTSASAHSNVVSAPGVTQPPSLMRGIMKSPTHEASIQTQNNRYVANDRRRMRTVAPPNTFRPQQAQPTFMRQRNAAFRPRPRSLGRSMARPFSMVGGMRPRLRNRSIGPGALKFDGDFDFEKANEEFSKLADSVNKLQLSSNAESNPTNTENVASDEAEPKSVIPPVESAVTNTQSSDGDYDNFYDKNKSFFDKISCEALEREKGEESKIRKTWQEEKQQNAETFGVPYNWNNLNNQVRFYRVPRGGGRFMRGFGQNNMMRPRRSWTERDGTNNMWYNNYSQNYNRGRFGRPRQNYNFRRFSVYG